MDKLWVCLVLEVIHHLLAIAYYAMAIYSDLIAARKKRKKEKEERSL
jgi:hypothetical protein